ncbi:MAG: biopolymer transporter ExbD [Kiritimatiellae bacterium]|nr:biopolymer transporter ExbD [Kiritimatiellia bacterium]
MKTKLDDAQMNMTPMIDVVFQLIIFFIVTIAMQDQQNEMHVRLALSPHGKAVEKKDPRTVYVDVEKNGVLRIAGGRISATSLQSLMIRIAKDSKFQVPVVVRGDAGVRHDEVRKVMDICARAGLWRIKFAAIKQQAKPDGG